MQTLLRALASSVDARVWATSQPSAPVLSANSGAVLALGLGWDSDLARHTDLLVNPKANLWHDLLPPELEAGAMGLASGEACVVRVARGDLVADRDAGAVFEIPPTSFARRLIEGRPIEPRFGRFYPGELIAGAAGGLPGDRRAFRVVGTGERLRVDLNHPLAGRELEFGLAPLALWSLDDERGGGSRDLGELVSAAGPGMQARWCGPDGSCRATDFESDQAMARISEDPDSLFYATPRLVDHVDTTAQLVLRMLHTYLLPTASRVLDLMASWKSHLPATAELAVTGLGLNRAELDANAALSERVVHDLNQSDRLPFEDGEFDAVVCTASIEYLVRPVAVLGEVARVLRPGGRLVISFTNRWFPPKAIRLWAHLHEFERLGLVLHWLDRSACWRRVNSFSLRGLPRPSDDRYADRLAQSDPVYAVWAERAGTD